MKFIVEGILHGEKVRVQWEDGVLSGDETAIWWLEEFAKIVEGKVWPVVVDADFGQPDHLRNPMKLIALLLYGHPLPPILKEGKTIECDVMDHFPLPPGAIG